jgi:hypothetical protein
MFNNNNYIDLYIFNQKKNTNNNNNNICKHINLHKEKAGKIYYNPSYSKEWKDSLYFYNKYNRINTTLRVKTVNKIIIEYFNLFFNKNFIKNWKNIRYIKNFKGLSHYKLYIGKVEIKHTNFKSMITVYVCDKDKQILLSFIKKKLYVIFILLKKIISVYLLFRKESNKLKTVKFLKRIIIIFLHKKLKKQIGIIWRYKLKNNLNKYKFEENFLCRLGVMFSKYFNKKIEFNIIKISNIKHNTDMITYNLGVRYRKNRKFNIISILALGFGNISFPFEEEIDRKPKLKIRKFVDLSLLKNKFKDLHLIHILNLREFFDLKLYEIYGLLNVKLEEKMEKTLDYIKYKKIRGLKFMTNGRLTMRYRADRAIHKNMLDGGLRNIDSSFKGLKVSMYGGNRKINTEYALYESKRRIGTYAVKGWISYL